MSRFNVRTPRPIVTPPIGFITAEPVASGRAFEGSPGYARDARSELFLLAVSTFLSGDRSFYESGQKIDARFQQLVTSTAVTHPQWTGGFLRWLRNDANVRTAAVIGAVEAARAMVKAKIPGSREIVRSVLVRPDEPGEALAYWISQYSRRIPKPIKRGIADAAQAQYTEYGFLKYDSSNSAVKFADVLELCHVDPGTSVQNDLFKYILGKRFNKDLEPSFSLHMIHRHGLTIREAVERPQVLLDRENLKQAGMTWEAAQSLLGTVVKDPFLLEAMKRRLWTELIPNMGYMALLRNLRNFDEVGINDEAVQTVIRRLTDPVQVARSRQLPIRFLSAFTANAHHFKWSQALETALQLSLQNVPELPGRSLILVDVSGSMVHPLSEKSTLTRVQAAGLFGSALAIRNGDRATLVAFGPSSLVLNVPKNAALLTMMKQFHASGGTYTTAAVQRHFAGHDRVIIITDEQSSDGDPSRVIPAGTPLYTWNLAGYKYGHTGSGSRRYTFGGLTDQAFGLIPLLEAGFSQKYPFPEMGQVMKVGTAYDAREDDE